jgi:hypothetical protein
VSYKTQGEVYRNIIEPNLQSFIRVEFTKQELLPIIELTKKVAEEKLKEKNYKIDGFGLHKRFMSGFISELAIERLLGINIIDYEQVENKTHSKYFNTPDLQNAGFNVGVKSAEYGKVPLIPTHNTYSQIICIRDTPKSVLVCGIATPEVLNDFQTEDLILAPSLKRINEDKRRQGNIKNIKTGFYGFNHLLNINTIQSLVA